MQEVKDSPGIDTDLPVSRQMETNTYDYYGWKPYWSTGLYIGGYGWGAGGMPPVTLRGIPASRGRNCRRPARG